MARKIDISKSTLSKLYSSKKLSSYQIAKKFNCNPTVIQKRLKEYKITLRNPKKKVKIEKGKLENLYINKKLSTQKIAKILGTSSCWVYHRLKEFDIKTRPKKIVKIDKEKLKELYYNKKLPLSKIAKLHNCTSPIVLKKMVKYGMKRRDKYKANTTYPKKKFRENRELKAYMIGFRLGDLNVRKDSENSSIIKIKSSTTKLDQYNLIKKVYGNYGHFWCKKYGEVYNMVIHLDKSFKFLVSKKDNIPSWILNNNKYFFAFLGGYSDAEGNISVSQERARFRIRSYDKNILNQISKKANFLDMNTKFDLVKKKGLHNKRKYNRPE